MKDELEEARQFTYGYNLEYHDINGVDCPKIDSIADLALAYHRHRLETAWVNVKEVLPEIEGKYLVKQGDHYEIMFFRPTPTFEYRFKNNVEFWRKLD